MNNDPDANIPCFSAVLIIETINTHKCFEMQIQSPVCPCCDDWCYVGSIQLLRQGGESEGRSSIFVLGRVEDIGAW